MIRVHPCFVRGLSFSVFDTYMAGTMLEALQNGTKEGVKSALSTEERAMVRLLKHGAV